MGHLLAIVLPLALGAAVSPTILALQLLTLSRRTAPLARSWAVAAGCALVLAGFSVLALLLARSTGGSDSPDVAGGVVKLVAAALLVAVGLRQLRKAPDAQPRPERESRHPLRASFALGAAMMLSNFSTIVLYFPAMHEIGIADAALADKLVAFALLFAITLLTAVGPPLVVTLMGARATPALERLNRFFTAHRRGIGAAICFTFAVLLTIAGLHAVA
ncbi:MAG TPA: GAP family protein [Conexibacter sp.]|nr:GAP family protein [Conexibacter sp.]